MADEKLKKEVAIDLLKRLVKELYEVVDTTVDELKDGYRWTDLIAILGQAKDLTFIFSKWEDIKEQAMNLTLEETEELVKYLSLEIGVEDEIIMSLIDNLFDMIGNIEQIVFLVKELKNRKLELDSEPVQE